MISTKGNNKSALSADQVAFIASNPKDFEKNKAEILAEAEKLHKAREEYSKAKDLDAERKKAKDAAEKADKALKDTEDQRQAVLESAKLEADAIIKAAQQEVDEIHAANEGYDLAKKQAADDLNKLKNEQANIKQQLEKELADLESKKKDLASAKDTYDSKVKDIVNFAKELQRD